MTKKSLFISNLGWDHFDTDKVLNLLVKNNFKGIDIAPIRLDNNWSKVERKSKKLQKKLDFFRLRVNAIQGIFYKTNFNLFKPDQFKINNHLKKIIKIAKIFKCKKIIIGSSRFRDNKNLSKIKSDIIFVNFFKKISTLLKKEKISICIETIPSNYGEKYLHNIDHLTNLIKKIKSPWVKINFDSSLFHFKKFDSKIFKKNFRYINNIQISEKKFDFFIKPSISNMSFSKLLKKNKKIKNVSLEIISNKTKLLSIEKSLKNLNKILN